MRTTHIVTSDERKALKAMLLAAGCTTYIVPATTLGESRLVYGESLNEVVSWLQKTFAGWFA